MEHEALVKSLAALGHEGRLSAFRVLMAAGPEGLASGEVARRTGIVQNTSSVNLTVLAQAGLLTSQRQGRLVVYSVSCEHFVQLLQRLVQDCCDCQPDLCGLLLAQPTSPGGLSERPALH